MTRAKAFVTGAGVDLDALTSEVLVGPHIDVFPMSAPLILSAGRINALLWVGQMP